MSTLGTFRVAAVQMEPKLGQVHENLERILVRGHPRLSSKFSLNAVSSALPCDVG